MGHQHIVATARLWRKTLWIVAGLYVAIGFLLLVPSALAGDRLSAFLGFLIISAALGFAAALTVVLRLAIRMSAIGESLDEVSKRLEGIEKSGRNGNPHPTAQTGDATSQILDLAAIGSGDPAVLTAGVLDRVRFPRLVPAVTEQTAANRGNCGSDSPGDGRSGHRSTQAAKPADNKPDSLKATGSADKDLLRNWTAALHEGDLATCREVLRNLVDCAAPDLLAELTSQLDDLSERTERNLRDSFSEYVRKRDHARALAVGVRICELFPDRKIAGEFERVRPYLQERASAGEAIGATFLATVP